MTAPQPNPAPERLDCTTAQALLAYYGELCDGGIPDEVAFLMIRDAAFLMIREDGLAIKKSAGHAVTTP